MAATDLTLKVRTELEYVAIDPTKCTVVIVHLPDVYTPLDIEKARSDIELLKEFGVRAGLVLPPGWRVEFAQQEVEDTNGEV